MGYSPERYAANKEKHLLKAKRWRENNPERVKENRKRYYEANKQHNIEYSTWYNRKRKFGISKEQYLELLDKQGGVCAICGSKCTKSLAVDHCHKTGKIRGLLCNSCNRGLGYLKDNPDILEKAINYLRGSNENQ